MKALVRVAGNPERSARADQHRSGGGVGRVHGVDPLQIVEFGALAAGVVVLVDRLRRVQQRHRPTGLRIALPEADLRSLEGRLRVGADPGPQAVAAAVLATFRNAAAHWAPRAVAVRVGPAVAELVLAGAPAGDPPPPFRSGSEPHRWVVNRDRILVAADPVATAAGANPGAVLATLGRDGDDVVFVDLVAARSLGIDDERGPSILFALAIELATSPYVGDLELVLAGCPESFYAFDRVRRVDRLARACAIAEQRVAEQRAEWLRTVGQRQRPAGPSTSGAGPAPERSDDPGMSERYRWPSGDEGDRWGSTVVCVATPPDESEAPLLQHLVELADASDGAVAVVAGWPAGVTAWTACARGGRLQLQCAGAPPDRVAATVTPQTVGIAAAVGIGDLVRVATTLHPVPPQPAPGRGLDPCAGTGEGWDRPAPDRDLGPGVPAPGVPALGVPALGVPAPGAPAVAEAVAGAVPQVDGTSEDASSCADGAIPGGPIGRDGVAPAHPIGRAGPAGGSVAGDTSGARVEVRVLGPIEVAGAERPFVRAWSLDLVAYLALHPSGAATDQWATALWPDRLMAPASLHSTASAARRALGSDEHGADYLPRSHGRLCLASTVTTDWQRLQEGASTADPTVWHACLGLVRGRPLDGLRAVDWAVLEGILPNIESTVVDLAHRLAESCLAVGDAEGARWAARQGLLVSPYDERLYRALLRAADLAGNPAGVEAAMAELVRLVAEDVEPYDAVHPETLELYRALSRRGERAAPR